MKARSSRITLLQARAGAVQPPTAATRAHISYTPVCQPQSEAYDLARPLSR